MAFNLTTPGIQFSISTSGGVLRFGNATAGGLASLGGAGDNVHDFSQFIFRATSIANAFSIENWGTGTYVSAESAPSSGPLVRLTSSNQSTTWFFRPNNLGASFNICRDQACSLLWAPYSDVGGAVDSNAIALTPATGAAYEQWSITAVANATTRPISSNTTNTSSTITLTPTSEPSQTSSTSDSTSSTYADAPSSTDGPASNLRLVQSCYPCGRSNCTFTPSTSTNVSDAPTTITETFSILIGQPVANCNPNSQETTKTTLGGTYELEQTYSVAQTWGVGLGLLGPSASTSVTVTRSRSERMVQTQETEVGIRPGQIGALVANITYTATLGNMRVGVNKTYLPFIAYQPERVLGYSVVYTDCGSKFQALTLPKSDCTYSAGVSLRAISHFFYASMVFSSLLILFN